MANSTGKNAKGRPQRNRPNRGKATMADHFKLTQTTAKTMNKLANTNAFAGLADDDAEDAASITSITSIKSNSSNNS